MEMKDKHIPRKKFLSGDVLGFTDGTHFSIK